MTVYNNILLQKKELLSVVILVINYKKIKATVNINFYI